jgi:DNA-binding NarL/FixJ family response regulator
LRISLEEFIEMNEELTLLFSFNSIEKWLMHVMKDNTPPYILFLDIGLPGISGLKAVSIIKKTYPTTFLIVITGDGSNDSVWEAITNGADGYLIKPISLFEIKKQIEVIKSGGAVLSPSIAEKLIKRINNLSSIQNKSKHELTKREQDVLELLIKGLTYKEVAHILQISSSTVNGYVKILYNKMGVNSKAELVSKVLSN